MRRRAARLSAPCALLIGAVTCGVSESQAGIRIIGPDEVLKRYVKVENHRSYLVVPELAPQELVTRVDDPIVFNKGDGSFHPFDPEVVAQAIRGLTFPVDQVDAVVYVLPYPRRAGLESAASPGAIFLSPGVRPIAVESAHAIVAHEFGHVVQYALARGGSSAWRQYVALRGLPNAGCDTDALAHADRPRELFAEDFRALLGSPQARTGGAIENVSIAPSSLVPGLAAFLLDLPDLARRTASAGRDVAVFPNPFVTTTSVAFAPRAGAALSTAAPARQVAVLDVRGRVVRHESVPAAGDGSALWRWDGADDHGVRLAPGAYFMATGDGDGRATRIVLMR